MSSYARFLWAERALLALSVVFYLFVFPHGTHGDGSVRYEALITLLTKGEWLVQRYPMIGPLCSAPLYYLSALYKEPHWWLSRFNSFLFLGALAILARLLRPFLPADSARRFILLLLVATMFPKHATDYYGEVFSATLAAVGTALFLRRRLGLGVASMALAFANTPATLVATVGAALPFVWRERRLRYFLPVALGGALMVAENLFRFGTITNHVYFADPVITASPFPYAHVNGFSNAFLSGALSILLSFGKGLFFFAPGLLLAVRAARGMPEEGQRLLWSWLLYVVGLVLIYAKWFAWSGDWFWGPRFFLFASLPAAFALHFLLEREFRSLRLNIVLLFAITLSVWVGLSGVAFGVDNLEECGSREGLLTFMCWYTPDFSALWRPFYVAHALTGKQTAFSVYFGLVYAYLSARLWRITARQAREQARDLWRETWAREWRF